MLKEKKKSRILIYLVLIVLGVVMLYPILLLVSASFKPGREIFNSVALLPQEPTISGYIDGWRGKGSVGFSTFMLNSFKMVLPTVLFTVISSTLAAYGFARFEFPFKNILFKILIATLMLPNAILIVPRYLIFRDLNMLDSYAPWIIPALLGGGAYYIYLMVQFFRGIPRTLDEAARIDGCNSFQVLIRIMVPMCLPAMASVAVFQFMTTWNDFLNSLIYINSTVKYNIALGLRLSLDTSELVSWNSVIAMSVVSIIPCVILFFAAQKYFMEGINLSSGIKG